MTEASGAHRRAAPLRAYLLGLVLLFAVVAVLIVASGRVLNGRDVANAVTADAEFAANGASASIESGLADAQAVVQRTAQTPNLSRAFDQPAGCSLSFAGAGPFVEGHLDLVDDDGTVGCSSLADATGAPYRDAPWLAEARSGPLVRDDVVDPRTGRRSVTVAAPIPDRGVVVAMLPVDTVAEHLAPTFGGRRGLELVVTDDGTIVSRSIDPGRWAGTPVAGTAFDLSSTGSPRADVSGVERFYGSEPAPTLGLRVWAGADADQALAPADSRFLRTLAITLAGLVLILVVTVVVYRKLTGPIRRLRREVRDASEGHDATITRAGPRELRSLQADVESLIASAQRELAATRELAAIVESSPDAIFSTDLDGVVTSWNAGAERLYGYSALEMVGQPAAVMFPDDRVEEGVAVLETVRAGRTVEQFETVRRRADGTLVEVSIAIAALNDADGSVRGASAIVRDISERNDLERAQRDLELRLHQSERLESLGQLAGGIAHDFNNLISLIVNFAQLASEQTVDPSVREDLDEIRAAGERATRLTRQLLLFGKRESDTTHALDVHATIADVHQLLAHSLGDHLTVAVDLAALDAHVRIDRGQMEQVLLNLAVNARDAMPDGGTITIATRSSPAPGPATPSARLELSVRDEGTGMAPEVVNRAFEPFFTTKGEGVGTGLGLATVHNIVTGAGGTIAIESTPGQGTTFVIALPISAERDVESDADVDAPVRGSGETVLVVEDEPALMDLISRLLERNGYRTLGATTGDAAL